MLTTVGPNVGGFCELNILFRIDGKGFCSLLD